MSSSEDREERAPLVYSLHVDSSAEDPLAQRSSSISNGAINILSRLPTNLNPPWRALAGVFGLLVITVTVVLIMYFFTTALVPAAFPIPHGISKRSIDHCDFANELESEASPWNNLLPLETQMKFVKDRRRIFFVKRQADKLTEANLCALKSAGREGRVFLIVLVPAATMRDEMVAVDEIKEAGLDHVVDVMVADPARYFSETLLSGYEEDDGSRRRELKDFAVKVVTLWRFGGAAYDLDLVTLKRSPGTSSRSDALEHSLGIEPKTETLISSSGIKPRSVTLEPASKIKPEASLKEDVSLKLSSRIEPPKATFEPSPGSQPKTEALEPLTSREPRSLNLGLTTVIEPETMALNRSNKTEPRIMIEPNSTWKNFVQNEPMAVTLAPEVATSMLSTENERKDSKAILANYSSTEPLSLSLKPTTVIEPDTVAFELADVEFQTMALNHSPEVAARSATLNAPPPLEAQIVAFNHRPGGEPHAPPDGNATVSEDGAILVANQPCHAFVFAIMRALVEVDLAGSEDATVSAVIHRAVRSFCGEDAGSCNGVKIVPEDSLCVGTAAEGDRCEWARVDGAGKDFDWSPHCT